MNCSSGIEMFHKTLDEACAGDQMGILLRGVKKDDVRRGMCVAKPGTVKQYDHFEAQVTRMARLRCVMVRLNWAKIDFSIVGLTNARSATIHWRNGGTSLFYDYFSFSPFVCLFACSVKRVNDALEDPHGLFYSQDRLKNKFNSSK